MQKLSGLADLQCCASKEGGLQWLSARQICCTSAAKQAWRVAAASSAVCCTAAALALPHLPRLQVAPAAICFGDVAGAGEDLREETVGKHMTMRTCGTHGGWARYGFYGWWHLRCITCPNTHIPKA